MIPAVIVQGHRVASGLNGNSKFPGGTLRMQSRPGATRVLAEVPREAIRRFAAPAAPSSPPATMAHADALARLPTLRS